MKLPKHARGVLKSLRTKQNNPKLAKTSGSSKTRYNVVLTDPRGEDTSDEEDELEPPSSARHREKARWPAAAGKEPHNKMAQTAIAIHEDAQCDLSTDQPELDDMADWDGTAEFDDESTSQSSEDSEDEIDESVVEDMRRLEQSFKGISEKYRLINRIGEGMLDQIFVSRSPPDMRLQAPSRLCTKPNSLTRLIAQTMRMISRWTTPTQICPLQRGERYDGNPRLWL
jgi:hypothetical protein